MAEYNDSAFNKQEIELADFARALSHPGRVAILKALSRKEVWTSGEITALLPLAQSTVSQHLLKLVSAGLVLSKSRNNMPAYSLNWHIIKKFERDFPLIFQ